MTRAGPAGQPTSDTLQLINRVDQPFHHSVWHRRSEKKERPDYFSFFRYSPPVGEHRRHNIVCRLFILFSRICQLFCKSLDGDPVYILPFSVFSLEEKCNTQEHCIKSFCMKVLDFKRVLFVAPSNISCGVAAMAWSYAYIR